MREEQIAPPLMFFGAVLMPYSLYGYPWLQRKVRVVQGYIVQRVVKGGRVG